MTSAAQPVDDERNDVRTMVGGGVKLGIITAIGVTVFALVSRPMPAGTTETVVQSLLVVVGGALFSYLPAYWVRPRSTDGIAWTALLGLLGAVAFTVVDTAVLRPLSLYHWTWDEIGGGSGFWYIPVWWMGAAVLAWLGAWVTAITTRAGRVAELPATAAQTCGGAIALFAILTLAGIGPFHTAMMALAFALALMLHVPIAAALQRR